MTNFSTGIKIETSEWQNIGPEAHPGLRGLFLSDSESRRAANNLAEHKFVEVQELKKGLRIRTKSYVGRISLGNINITIRPKIEQMPLMALLRYGYELRHIKLFDSKPLESEESGFQEVLILQLASEVQNLISRGLSQRYLRQQRTLSWPRGRVNLPAIARQCGMYGEGLPCIVHPRSADSLHNRVVLAGLFLAAGISMDRQLAFQCRQLASRLVDSVTSVPLSRKLIESAWRQNNRLTAHYEPIFKLIQLLMESLGIWFEGLGEQVVIPGFLFDMNRLFQNVLSRFLRDNLSGFTVRDEFSFKGMAVYSPDFNPQRKKAPPLRPDFVVHKKGETAAVLDAKYRDLWKSNLPREMLYQLGIYSLAHPRLGRAVILYPTMDRNAAEARIRIKDIVGGGGLGEVALRPVWLPSLVDLIDNDASAVTVRERQKYARYMAFGN